MPNSRPSSLVEKFRLKVEKLKAKLAHKTPPDAVKKGFFVYHGNRYDPPEAA